MTAFGKLLAKFYVISLYRMKGGDKNAHDFIWNWWNPVAWVLGPLGFLVCCFIEGVPYTWKERRQIGFGMNPWYADNGYEIEWVRSYDGA